MRALLVVALASCSTDSGRSIDLHDFPRAYHAANCAHLVTCHEVADLETCIATNPVGELSPSAQLVADVETGHVLFDGSAFARCLGALAATTCNPGDLVNRRSFGTCLSTVFRGLSHDGEACFDAVECGSQVCTSRCDPADRCCLGTCTGEASTELDTPPIGGTCVVDPIDPCPVGSFCATGICTPVLPLGSTCTATSQCADGLQCDTLASLQCVAVPHRAEHCTSSGRCGDEGTYCNGITSICTDVGLVGASCGPGYQCSKLLRCDPATTTCQPYAALGDDCAATGNRCNDDGTACANGSCAPVGGLGASCTANDQCAPFLACIPSTTDVVTTATCEKQGFCPLP